MYFEIMDGEALELLKAYAQGFCDSPDDRRRTKDEADRAELWLRLEGLNCHVLILLQYLAYDDANVLI